MTTLSVNLFLWIQPVQMCEFTTSHLPRYLISLTVDYTLPCSDPPDSSGHQARTHNHSRLL